MKNLYKKALGEVRLTESGKRSLAAALAAGTHGAVPRPRRVLRTGLVAAVLACGLVLAVGAAVVAMPVLRVYFGGGQVYDHYVQPIGLSQTVNGYTITITDAAGDDQFLYLGIELAAPEGTVPDPILRIGDGDETVVYSGYESGVGSGGGLRIVEDDDPTDNKLRFVWFRWVEKPLSGHDMTITFHDLIHREWAGDGVPPQKVVDVEGDWSFGPFRLDFFDRSIDLTPDVKVPLLGGETTVTGIKMTPLHVEVMLEGGCLVDIHTTGPEKDGCWGLCTKETTLALYGKDGTTWDLPEPHHSGTWITTAGDRTGIVFSYNQLLNMEDLGSFEICGVMIPIAE